MKGFKAFLAEQQKLEEGIVKKGAVAAYSLQARGHGNSAFRSYSKAKQTLRAVTPSKSTDAKVDALTLAVIDLLDGLISQRLQIGSVSAQVTALSVL